MRRFGFSWIALLVLSLLEPMRGAAAVAASCTNYTKGEFGPETVASDEICERACQTAEGLPVGRFKSEGDFRKCTCLRIDNSGSAKETRDLCQDGTSGSAERVVVGTGLFLATTAALVAVLSM